MELLATVIGIITGMGALYVALRKSIKKIITEAIKTEVQPIKEDLEQIHKDIKDFSKQDCKNFLVKFLNDKHEGLPQNEACINRAHEVKDKYKKDDGNSYIQATWEHEMDEEW